MISENLHRGRDYSKKEIEEIFETKFGFSLKGITLRKWDSDTSYIIIFSRANGPYTDVLKDDILIYDGEGLHKDQTLTGANKAIIHSNETNRIMFGFHQETPNGKWKFIGLLKLLQYEYKTKHGFKTYEFMFKIY
ncbi:MAG: hypothetical protein QCI00_02490 [Candidatus Thermoplasmatota archaeon]|nr:hypothetical protein [Candidatus Thermoplasmatota archaeon]